MRSSQAIDRGLTRFWGVRSGVPVAVVILLLAVLLATSGRAVASRVETSPSHTEELLGSDWVGKVSVFFSEIDSPSGKASFSLTQFRFANGCSRRGSLVRATIRVDSHGRFDFDGPGFFISGHEIGKISYPTRIVGLATVAGHSCHSGPWWFSVKPRRSG